MPPTKRAGLRHGATARPRAIADNPSDRPSGPAGGVPATGKPVEVRDTAIWHFQNGKVTEILTLQDQFAILKQTGYFPDSVHAA